jgi:dihydroorotate dehydrogenase (NAD+) catalytic subunit
MILAGATAVSIGTANFADPKVSEKVVNGIEDYMKTYGVEDIRELIGAVHE